MLFENHDGYSNSRDKLVDKIKGIIKALLLIDKTGGPMYACEPCEKSIFHS
jgi:hypothetical protein